MKKILAVLLAAVICLPFTACGENPRGEISALYGDPGESYQSEIRAALRNMLDDAGLAYREYDAGGDKETQNKQGSEAIFDNSSLLIVSVADTDSNDGAAAIVEKARAAKIPVIFFDRPVEESVIASYDKCMFVGTDDETAGHVQGRMIGEYLVENYSAVDRNNDGVISYVLFQGQEKSAQAAARTQYSVEDCNTILTAAGKPELAFYDESNPNRYLADKDGLWSSAAAANYMSAILETYNETGHNTVELVIANNDEMALGAVSALRSAGYNQSKDTAIPVFGIGATDAAASAVANGWMTGTVRKDAAGVAETIFKIIKNFRGKKSAFDGIEPERITENRQVNIPYLAYTGE